MNYVSGRVAREFLRMSFSNFNYVVIPEAIGCFLFVIVIVKLSTSGHSITSTPFYIFFYSTGIAGILSIMCGWFIRFSIFLPVTPNNAYIAFIGHIGNGIFILAHTLGKTFGLLNRYDVLLKLPYPALWWTRRNLTKLILIQFLVPTLIHIYYFQAEINWLYVEGMATNTGLTQISGLLNRLVYGSSYIVYVFVSIFLNARTVMRLRKLIKGGSLSQNRLLHQHKVLVLYGICSTLAHFLCAIHQLFWAWAYFEGNEFNKNLARDLSGPVEDVTTFCNPLLLLLLNPQARYSFYNRSMTRTKVKSTSQSFCPSVK